MGAQEMFRGRLTDGVKLICPMCVKGGHSSAVEDKEVLLGEAGSLECVDKFCCLGDMLGCGGGVDDAVKTRVKCACGKFRKLEPILTQRVLEDEREDPVLGPFLNFEE